MSRRVAAVTTSTIIDHRMFMLVDEEQPGAEPAMPHDSGDWVSAGPAAVLVESPYDSYDAMLRLEEWDAEPERDGEQWDDVVDVTVAWPTGKIRLNQITAGYEDTGFALTGPGSYHVRLACRQTDEEEYLVQFWPAAG
ncbi:hypothetical protein [Actinoplanes aureus]|uniref:Uncharacterized protein n=1 Tax=Actinoplanes aureus TaxID=2792083 RepID=A0A931C8S1_9ACTN|nr:hypothetical protein [Actinoplanes aureus]MBG0565539.1 hypothetical protein [Actinoplanes aureus]